MLKNLPRILLSLNIIFTIISMVSCKESNYIDPNIQFVNLRTNSVLTPPDDRCEIGGLEVKIFSDSNLSTDQYIKTIRLCKTANIINDIATVGSYNYHFSLKLAAIMSGDMNCKNGGITLKMSSSFNDIKNDDTFQSEPICFDNKLPLAKITTPKESIDIFSNGHEAINTVVTLINESENDALIKNISFENNLFIVGYNSCDGIIFKRSSCDLFLSTLSATNEIHDQINIEFENADKLNIKLIVKESNHLDGSVFNEPIYIFADDYAEVASEILTIKNTTDKPIKITNIRYTAEQFFTDNNSCGDTVLANSECEIKIGYIPLDINETSVSTKIIIDFDSYPSIIADITGVNNGAYFGDIVDPLFAVNDNTIIKSNDKNLSTTADIIVINNSEKTYEFLSAFVVNKKYFSIIKTDCTTLAPDSSCKLTVSYRAGEQDIINTSAILKFDFTNLIVNISGASEKPPVNNSNNISKLQPVIKISDDAVLPKSVSVIKFRNEGNAILKNVSIVNTDKNFYYYNPCTNILPLNECKIFAIYLPSEFGTFKDNVTITLDNGSVVKKEVIGKMTDDFVTNIIYKNLFPLGLSFTSLINTSDNTALTYAWSFGDNTTSSSAEVNHQYLKSGKYPITLTVKNSAGKSATKRKLITLSKSLSADFTVTVDSKTITLNPSVAGSDDSMEYHWEFGDGNKFYDNFPLAKHTYSKAGRYRIKLTVTNSLGSVIAVTKYITIF